jgi:hypothetical protein
VRPVIKDRQEFDDCLLAALPTIKRLIAGAGADPVLVSVLLQLQAIQQWTANGQDVTPEQNKRIVMGLQALRQMENFPDEQDLIVTIDNYIKTVMVPWDGNDQGSLG